MQRFKEVVVLAVVFFLGWQISLFACTCVNPSAPELGEDCCQVPHCRNYPQVVLQVGSFTLQGIGIVAAELTLGVIGSTETLLAVSGHKEFIPMLCLVVVPLYADPHRPVPHLHEVFGTVSERMQLPTVIGGLRTTISVNHSGIIKTAAKNMVIVNLWNNEQNEKEELIPFEKWLSWTTTNKQICQKFAF